MKNLFIKIRYWIIIAIFLPLIVNGQDPQLSQFYSIPTYLGPSFAGAVDGSRAVLNYRDQWPGMNKAYITYAFSYDRNFPKYKSGAGLLLLRDQAGEIKYSKTYLGLQYAYVVPIGFKWVFRPGLTFFYQRSHYDVSELTLGHQINSQTGEIGGLEKTGFLKPASNTFDFTASGLIYHKNFWIGLTADHLLRPNESLIDKRVSRIPMKFTTYSGFRFDLNRGFIIRKKEKSITLAYFYKWQNQFNQFDIGGYWTREPLTFGIWYRGIPIKKFEYTSEIGSTDFINHDALIFMVGGKLEQFKFSYNYDITISNIHTNSHGSHEMAIIYNIPYKEMKKRIKPLPCPWF